jgi:hypothetical protein
MAAALRQSCGLLAKTNLCLVVFFIASVAAAKENRRPLELAWISTTGAQLAALTEQAVECVKPIDNYQFNLGRLAFNSPRLLGGQAGRMGLSCASCHPAGRANNAFFVSQISDSPGRADISHHFLSSQGGDQIFNPKNIPDLAAVESLRFQNRNDEKFDQLLIRLIEVEFDGQTPNEEVFAALKLYLASNDVTECSDPKKKVPRNLEADWQLIDDGLSVLHYSVRSQNLSSTEFVTSSLRTVLELFYRFYGVYPTPAADGQMKMISRLLQSLAHEPAMAKQLILLENISVYFKKLKKTLISRESHSLYNVEVAQGYLSRQGQK